MFLCQKTCLPGDHDTSIHKSHRIHTHTVFTWLQYAFPAAAKAAITLITGPQYAFRSPELLGFNIGKLYQKLLGFSMEKPDKSYFASVWKNRTKVTSLQYGNFGQDFYIAFFGIVLDWNPNLQLGNNCYCSVVAACCWSDVCANNGGRGQQLEHMARKLRDEDVLGPTVVPTGVKRQV